MATMFAFASPALAQNYDYFIPNYNYFSRSDSISLSAGDANRANIAIQTPTPWPRYLNKTTIYGNGQRAADLMERYNSRYSTQAEQSGNATVNITQPSQ